MPHQAPALNCFLEESGAPIAVIGGAKVSINGSSTLLKQF